MKLLVNSAILLLGFAFIFGGSLDAQNQKEVTVNITIESDGYKTRIDTTFIVDRESDADRVIDALIKSRYSDQQKMEKVVIIKDAKNNDAVLHGKVAPRKKSKAMMGVYLETNSRGEGVRITSVTRGGAAEAAGLRRGDLILEIDGKRLGSYHDLVKTKEAYEPGDEMRVIFLRDGDRFSTELTLKGETSPHITFEKKQNTSSQSRKAFLGVYTDELSADQARRLGLTSQQGIYLEGIVPYSGAARGGLKKGDVIVSIDGRPLDASWELGDALGENRPGDQINISFIRDGRYQNTLVTLTDKETVNNRKPKKVKVKTQKAFLGVHLENESGGGVRITGIVDNSAAEAAGLRRGDIILSMGRYTTETYGDLSKAMTKFTPNERVRIIFDRDGRTRSTSVTMGSKTVEKWVEVPAEEDMDEDFDEDFDLSPRRERDTERELRRELEELVRNSSDRRKAERLVRFMNEPSLEMDLFQFYPNPNNGRFTLRFRPEDRGDLQIRIYNLQGKEVYLEYIQDFRGEYNKEINISKNAPRGTYFLQLTQGDRGMVKRIVVK
ncbi:MAG: PDZ domain-containing protein [Bacteroidia bacterium]|nr:PDZ domain-containing protein [Bacteroidia bacterium]